MISWTATSLLLLYLVPVGPRELVQLIVKLHLGPLVTREVISRIDHVLLLVALEQALELAAACLYFVQTTLQSDLAGGSAHFKTLVERTHLAQRLLLR